MSAIQWTNETWNPVCGCSVVSPGCTHCYAMTAAGAARLQRLPQYAGLVRQTKAGWVWTGEVRLWEPALDKPRGWRRPRLVFVNSMSDTFQDAVPDAWLDRIFAAMRMAPQHTYQMLTKRPAQARRYLAGKEPLPNVWLGCSVEDQLRAFERVPELLATPAALRWLSCEPVLAPLDLTPWLARLDWVVVGGESGGRARAFNLAWARDILAQCRRAGVPVFMKQLGRHPTHDGRRLPLKHPKGGEPAEWPADLRIREWPAIGMREAAE